VLLLTALAACAAPADDGAVDDGAADGAIGDAAAPADVERAWTEGTTRDGRTLVRWRGEEGALVSNRMAALEIELFADGAPVEGAVVAVSAFMPDHGHGTNLDPVTEELGGGRYRADGVLLHMPGYWELHVDVIRGGLASRATFELDL
jgi:hypothetical protein